MPNLSELPRSVEIKCSWFEHDGVDRLNQYASSFGGLDSDQFKEREKRFLDSVKELCKDSLEIHRKRTIHEIKEESKEDLDDSNDEDLTLRFY